MIGSKNRFKQLRLAKKLIFCTTAEMKHLKQWRPFKYVIKGGKNKDRFAF